MVNTHEKGRYISAAGKIGIHFTTTVYFIANALDWLAREYGDIHLEYHQDTGWQISTCYANGEWGEDGWLRGDGTMESALCLAVELTKPTARYRRARK